MFELILLLSLLLLPLLSLLPQETDAAPSQRKCPRFSGGKANKKTGKEPKVAQRQRSDLGNSYSRLRTDSGKTSERNFAAESIRLDVLAQQRREKFPLKAVG